MFNFLKSNKKEPLDYERRKYFENNLLWLIQEFPKPGIEDRQVICPTPENFPIQWNASEENANAACRIICENMQLNHNEIELDFYDNGMQEIDMGTSVIFMENHPEDSIAAGLYHHERNEEGKYQVSIDQALLEAPDNLIATLAHELVHVKLLGEKKLDFNDEMLTDFATVFFGLGIFNANTAFQFHSGYDRWGYKSMGYLSIEEWAYALALFAFIRHEDNPLWSKHLAKPVLNEFNKSMDYMLKNEGEIFNFNEQTKS